MSAFIFILVVFGIGYFLVSMGKSTAGNSEIDKRVNILRSARQNAHVSEIINILNSARFVQLSPEKINSGLRLVDTFIDANDIRFAEDVKNELYGLLNGKTISAEPAKKVVQAKEISSRTITEGIALLNKIKRPNADIYRLKNVLYKLKPGNYDSEDTEELVSIVEDIYYASETYDNAADIKEVTSDSLYDIISIIGDEYAAELIPDYFSNTATQSSTATVSRTEPIKTAKKDTVSQVRTEVVKPADNLDKSKREVKKPKISIKIDEADISLEKAITDLEKAGQAVNDKKLADLVHKILVFLRQAPNSQYIGSYTMYLVNMLDELAVKPPYMSMGATIIAENMLETYRALAEGRSVNVENAFKAIRTDLSMRGFTIE